METLEKLKESGVAPTEFWYLSTLILTGILVLFIGILIFFVKAFFTKLQATLDNFATSISELTTIVKLHELQIKDNKEDIGELKKRRR